MTWVAIGNLAQFPSGSIRLLDVASRCIAVLNIEGKLFAIDDRCPHRGGPLSEGEIKGKVIRCPWHNRAFDLDTGKCLSDGRKLSSFSVMVEDGLVKINLTGSQ